MNRRCSVRILSTLLAVAMLLTLCPTALAADLQELPFYLVGEGTSANDLREPVSQEEEVQHRDTDLIRVSIVLEETPGLEWALLSSGMDTAAQASSPLVTQYRTKLVRTQDAMAQTISQTILNGQKLDVIWNLTLTANLISANVPYGKIDEIRALPGVASVVPECRYEPAVYEIGTADPNMSTSAEMIGTSSAYAAGYTGAGSRIAIIDTGTDLDHQSFDPQALEYALSEDGGDYELLDAEEIGRKLTQLNAYSRSGATAEDFYFNTKVPFGYNYIDNDLDITHDNDGMTEHGSHVAGIAAANRFIPDGDGFTQALTSVLTQGVAPDAQIITMKVFGKNGGAFDSDYMAAVEDAIVLGCDAINLSLGSTAPGYTENEVYKELLDRLTETDTVVTVSAGNAGSWADGTWNGYLYSDGVSLDMVGSPGSYTNPLTVASVNNVGYTGQGLSVAGRSIFYTENLIGNQPMSTLAGQELEYVLIEGIGRATGWSNIGDWEGIDLTGKVAVCSRGETTFSEKANYAVEKGAIAVIIYNNTPGVFGMNLSGYNGTAPCVSITQDDGAWMMEKGTLHEETVEVTNYWGETIEKDIRYYVGSRVCSEGVDAVVYDTPYTMSSFSSWGVPGDLSLKPEITAPGGNIYSINGALEGGQAYETMSGTSMAAPQVAGMAALLTQHLRETGLHVAAKVPLRQLSQSLLMSTAEPIINAETGTYYPVIQQGAGLANIGNAVSADSFIQVDGQEDGKVKAELGDDPERTGEYSFTFTLNNLTGEDRDYLLSTELFTQDIFESYETWDEADTAWYLSKNTTPLEADISWMVDGQKLNGDNSLVHMDFNNDGTVNSGDAQTLLDYVTGVRTDVYQEAYADMDGSGDVTTYDVYLFENRLNSGKVQLPAGGKVTITVSIMLTEAQKEVLDAHYPNGAYVEGYVFAVPVATEEGVLGVSHSIPVLAYYGNWTDPSMFETGTYFAYDSRPRSETRWPYMGSVVVNYITALEEGNGTQYYWGANLASYLWGREEYLPERAALNNQNGDSLCQYRISPIRNAANGMLTIYNPETGEVYKQRELGPMSSGFFYEEAGQWYQTERSVNLTWNGTDALGQPLPEGSQAVIKVTLAPEYYVDEETGEINWDALGKGASVSTLVTIDNTAPEITGISVDPVSRQVTITARDNRFVAAVTMSNPDEMYSDTTEPVNQKTAGETVSHTFDLEWFTGTRLEVTVYDYAGNSSIYEVRVGELLGNEEIVTEFSAFSKGEWMSFDRDTDPYSVGYRHSTLENVQAATNVDGKVFLATTDGRLYVQNEDLRDEPQYIRTLPLVLTDLAYNPVDGYLYGISATHGLVRVDKLTGEATELGSPSIPTGTLACDANGIFYSLSCADNSLYWFTLDTLAEPEFLGKMTGSKEEYDWDLGEYVQIEVEYPVNATQQSLEWSCNDGKLYWMQYDNPEDITRPWMKLCTEAW